MDIEGKGQALLNVRLRKHLIELGVTCDNFRCESLDNVVDDLVLSGIRLLAACDIARIALKATAGFMHSS